MYDKLITHDREATITTLENSIGWELAKSFHATFHLPSGTYTVTKTAKEPYVYVTFLFSEGVGGRRPFKNLEAAMELIKWNARGA